MDDRIRELFIQALNKPKKFDKEDIMRVGEEYGLELKKRMSKKDIINKISEEHFEALYEAFEEFVYIPSWEVAKFYNLKSEDIDNLSKIAFFKETPVVESFYSQRYREHFEANTYNIDILNKYTLEDVKTAYKNAYEQTGYRTRITTKTEEEAHKLIYEFQKHFLIDEKFIDTYEMRDGEGYNTYFTVKERNNTKEEENALLLEIQKLKDEKQELKNKIQQLKNENREEFQKLKERVIEDFELEELEKERDYNINLNGSLGSLLLDIAVEYANLKHYKENHKDVQKLKNERNAGRKAKFTEQEKEAIRMYRLQNKTIKEIAELYNCSVGLIHKIINEKK